MFIKNKIKIYLLILLIKCVLSDKVYNNISNRPLIHYTPKYGWMNDPNGLFYDKKVKIWHLYYQYNPNDTIWGLPLYWGHATSKDFVNWEHHNVAISPENNNEGIYSGSIIVDNNNSTDPNQRIVAIYTNNIPDSETQYIAYSLDGGYTFIKYENNPVINVNSTQFRDPKVFWHEETNQWIMVVSKSQEYKIQIFGSPNLKNWKLHSNFTSGYYGYQYECPGLIKVPIENSNKYKWVMFLAINPGSPMGGSANQYFIGDFDITFKVIDSSISHKNNSNFDIIIGSPKDETIRLGFDPVAQAFYIDRGIPTNKFYKNTFFTDKISTYLEPFSYDENKYVSYQVYGLVDRNIIELYFNNGSTTMTNTFFMSKGNLPNSIKIISAIDNVFKIDSVKIRLLSL